MADPADDSDVLDYFERSVKDFIVDRLSHTDDWWNACIPPEMRRDASERHRRASKINDLLNKPDYVAVDYLNFDGYEKIISRRDNWKNRFEAVFLDKRIFKYKMMVLQSLRNDIRHGRQLDEINSTRLRLHCYDILSQVYEARGYSRARRRAMTKKLGFGHG